VGRQKSEDGACILTKVIITFAAPGTPGWSEWNKRAVRICVAVGDECSCSPCGD